MNNQIKYIRKSQQMELIKNQIQLSLTKTELNQLIVEALADTESSAAIKRVLNPLLADKFPQFPEFTSITLGDTDEAGVTQVILKQPPTPRVTGPIKSIEPPVIDEPEETPTPTEYVEPSAE